MKSIHQSNKLYQIYKDKLERNEIIHFTHKSKYKPYDNIYKKVEIKYIFTNKKILSEYNNKFCILYYANISLLFIRNRRFSKFFDIEFYIDEPIENNPYSYLNPHRFYRIKTNSYYTPYIYRERPISYYRSYYPKAANYNNFYINKIPISSDIVDDLKLLIETARQKPGIEIEEFNCIAFIDEDEVSEFL